MVNIEEQIAWVKREIKWLKDDIQEDFSGDIEILEGILELLNKLDNES